MVKFDVYQFSRIPLIEEFENFGDSALYGELITFILKVVLFKGLLLLNAKM